MKLYRFSPIQSEEQLRDVIYYLHVVAHDLCRKTLGVSLPIAENVGIFTHYREEFNFLNKLCQQLTDNSTHFRHKYYLLNKSVKIDDSIYKYLYIRQPDPYRAQVGDVDFVMAKKEFDELKEKIATKPNQYPYVRVFPRSDLDMIELHHPDIDVLSYVVIGTMTEKLTEA